MNDILLVQRMFTEISLVNHASRDCKSKSRITLLYPVSRHGANLVSITHHAANFGTITQHAKILCHLYTYGILLGNVTLRYVL